MKTLDDLLAALLAIELDEDKQPIMTTVHADLPQRSGLVIWEELPTFGGAEPRNTVGVWSWDETRLLVGEGRDDLRIIDREEW